MPPQLTFHPRNSLAPPETVTPCAAQSELPTAAGEVKEGDLEPREGLLTPPNSFLPEGNIAGQQVQSLGSCPSSPSCSGKDDGCHPAW